MKSTSKSNQENPGEMLFSLAASFMISRTICAAAQLGIADLIDRGVQHIDDMAKQLNADPDSLHRLMRALTSVGLFVESSPQQYELTPMSVILLEKSTISLKHCLAMMADKSWWDAWSGLNDTVLSGEPTIIKVLGMDFDAYLAQHPDRLKTFQNCLAMMARVNNPAILGAFDFSRCKKIVDVGGGHGALLYSILQSHPTCKGVLFDVEQVLQKKKEEPTLSARIEYKAGDFFIKVPADGDIYILKQILHDWSDTDALTILQNCRKVMHSSSRLLIIQKAD